MAKRAAPAPPRPAPLIYLRRPHPQARAELVIARGLVEPPEIIRLTRAQLETIAERAVHFLWSKPRR